MTQDPARASHLAAPCILRTHKFVSALAYAPIIISTAFIDACLDKEELVNPEDFILKDDVNEKKLGMSLKLTRQRAKENHNQLLLGRTIYCVENIHGGFETFKSIIEANGGQCHSYKGRPTQMVPSRRSDRETSIPEDDGPNEVYLLSGPDKEYARIWTRFKQMAENSRQVPRIVRADWLLEVAMTQTMLPVGAHELGKS